MYLGLVINLQRVFSKKKERKTTTMILTKDKWVM